MSRHSQFILRTRYQCPQSAATDLVPFGVTTMNRSPLILAVAALALTACSSSDLTGPTAAAPAVSADRHTPQIAVDGTYAGAETGVFQPATNTVLLTVLGSGNASLLGHYTSESDFVLDIATGTTVGTIMVKAADGSTISTTATGVGIATNGISQIVETATITGGTGRFAGASGALRIERTLNQSTGQSSGSISGSIHHN